MNIPQDINQPISEELRKEWVQKYPELKAYEDGLRSVNSKQHCIKDIIRYCRITGKNPSELCHLGTSKDEKVDEASKLLKAFCNEIENWRINYPSARCPLEYSMAWSIAKSVRGFYRENLLDLPKAIGKLSSPVPSQKRCVTPTRQDLRNLREEMKTFRDRVLIHFGATVCLRKNEIRGITWQDFDLNEEYPYIILDSTRLKGNYPNVWFVGIISKSLKKELIQLKEEVRKKFTDRGLEFSSSTPVFVTHKFNRETETYEGIGYSELGRIINNARKRMIKKYGVDISLHDNRRYFENRLDYAISQGIQVPQNYRNWLTAHKLKGSAPHYNLVKDSIPHIIELWKKLESFIDLDFSEETVKDVTTKKVKEMIALGKTPEEIVEEMMKEFKGAMQFLTQQALTEQQKKAKE